MLAHDVHTQPRRLLMRPPSCTERAPSQLSFQEAPVEKERAGGSERAKRARERERERGGIEREGERDRYRERHMDRHTKRRTDRDRERQTHTVRGERHTDTHVQTERQQAQKMKDMICTDVACCCRVLGKLWRHCQGHPWLASSAFDLEWFPSHFTSACQGTKTWKSCARVLTKKVRRTAHETAQFLIEFVESQAPARSPRH